MGCDMSRLFGRKKVEKTYTITDNNNIIWKIEKYHNDLTFKKGVLRLDYRIVNQGGDLTKFPRVNYVQLKSSTPITDTVSTYSDIVNLIETPIDCGSGGYIGAYNETYKCVFTKGKYYQAFIIIHNKEMINYIETIVPNPENTSSIIILNNVAKDVSKYNPENSILKLNIKGQVFVSSVKQFTETDGFDDYITDKKTDEVIRGPTLVGYTHPNKLISKEYYQIK
jgi:hypothetical protein